MGTGYIVVAANKRDRGSSSEERVFAKDERQGNSRRNGD
jgi:hypothetical protein